MGTLLVVLFWLGVGAGLLALYGLLAARFLHVEPQPDAVHFVTSSDGWRLGLSRYRPARPLGAPPVLLCPGLALSGRLFDLGRERSLARYLAEYGYDVWVLDWRGRGLSERPRLFGSRRYTWSFDDYLEFDLPAALQALQAETGLPRAFGVGFGLGGLVLLGGAGGPAAARLAGVAALGSAAFFRRAGSELSAWSLRVLRRARVEPLVRLASPLLGRVYPGPLSALQNRDAIEPAIYRRALNSAASTPSPREVRQLEDWLQHDAWSTAADERDYRRLLGQVSAPVLLLAGVRDLLAPPEAVQQTAAALAAAERQVIQASRLQGMASNYGHLDVVIGANAARDTYPHLLRWLDAHAGIEPPAGRPEPPRGELAWPAPTPAEVAPPTAPSPPASPEATPPPAAPVFAAEQAEADAEKDEPEWLEGEVPGVPRPGES